MTHVLAEILEWSKERPAWQRDALRRLVTGTEITDLDVDELKDLCKVAHGLAKDIVATHLAAEHVTPQQVAQTPINLASITHHVGVNALAAEQTIEFGPNLTVVFGRNAAGKSGFTRILKRACRTRGPEEILGNVLATETPVAGRATIAFRKGDQATSYLWTQSARPNDDLSAISVFDAQSASAYLREKTDVAFRPFGLDIFDKLSTICNQVRARLEQEQKQLEAIDAKLPVVPEGTRVHALLGSLTALTDVNEIRRLATLSDDEQARLAFLRGKFEDSKVKDGKGRGQELIHKVGRLNALLQHLDRVKAAVSGTTVATYAAADENLKAAHQTLEILRRAAFPTDLLNGTGGRQWFSLWEAAQSFSAVAYPEARFPVIVNSQCVLCQQAVSGDAASRFVHFAEYAGSTAQAAVRTAEGEREISRQVLLTPEADRQDVALALDELSADAPELANKLRAYRDLVAKIQQTVSQGEAPEIELPPEPPIEALRRVIAELRDRSGALLREEPALDEVERGELQGLETRLLLAGAQQNVINEIERKKRIAAYRQCLDDTTTNVITRKSTELTKALVSDQLRETFKNEIAQIEFTDLAVDIQPAGGAKGALFHKIVFANAPNVNVATVLSEGESRALSLAAFMTELSTSDVRSSIVFDDPVSSLDHIWRDRIARRLTIEAKARQVVVFTHDVVFLRALIDNAEKQDVAYQHQYVRRDGLPGISSSQLPWFAMRNKDRLGVLRNDWQAVDKEFRKGSREIYDRNARVIYGMLREAWEQAVGEVLLNDVLERFRPSIETQRLRVLHDIAEADCNAVDLGMTECSRWIVGHDHAAADDSPVPEPAQLRAQIDALDAWVQTITQRRRK